MSNGQTTIELRRVPISKIVVSKLNPRVIDPEAGDIKDLAASIAASGVIEPVHVRQAFKNGSVELLAGERRIVAAKLAGCDEVPVIDHGAIGDDDAFEITFLENFGRKDLTVIEESRAAAMCVVRFGSVEKAAERLGKSVAWVAQRVNIEKGLSDEWKREIAGPLPFSAWPASHIALIARLPAHIQVECIDDFCDDDSVITRTALETRLAERAKLLVKAPWDMDKTGPDKKTPACSKCSNRSGVQPGLWDDPAGDTQETDQCLDVECWRLKYDGHLKGRLKELKDQYGKVICLATRSDLGYGEVGDLRKRFGGFEYASELKLFKKPAAGRAAAMVVFGTGIGELRWVEAKAPSGTGNRTGGGSSGESAVSHPKPHPKPKTLKERRGELDSKRWFEVLKEMAKLVARSTADDITVPERTLFIMNIAVMWGSDGGETYYGPVAKKMQKAFGEYLVMESEAESQAAADRALWERVRGKVVRTVAYGDAITRVPKDKIDNAKIIAAYLGIDIKAMLAKQSAAIAEPASWKNLNADGTPKAAAKKSTKELATEGTESAEEEV